jgi:hypothetical protein
MSQQGIIRTLVLCVVRPGRDRYGGTSCLAATPLRTTSFEMMVARLLEDDRQESILLRME